MKTNDSDVPSLLDGCEDEMQIHLSSERRLDDVALLSEIQDPRSEIRPSRTAFQEKFQHESLLLNPCCVEPSLTSL